MSVIDLQAFRQTHEQLAQAIEGLDERQLKEKEAPGKWSVTEVLAHLADHSIVVSFRIRDILADTEAGLPRFDQDRWVSGQHGNEEKAAEHLAAFAALLRANARLLERLDAGELAKRGITFKGDPIDLRGIVDGFVRHVGTHLAQIARIRRAVEAVR
ncbi:DinB family protein [Paenibacillus sp. B01]|uniref:DinB family protein n=1 Tax=Paenibacillus sp. B01 TaxID=2660554 RepID=UPI00129B29E5|nr:DinB family protein [Paenibacillus sp. B01]QGG54447.1 DUF664 domain-containing protein [Paenibacillus sp. B01]